MTSFRDRFFTPKVFRALWSPINLGLLVAITVVGIVVGLPIVAAVAIGVGVYAAKVLLSVPRNERVRRIDPFVLSEPWRRYVQSALSAKMKFDRTVRSARPGPIKDRLVELSSRLERAVEESWRIATKGDEIDDALARINTRKAQAELDRIGSNPSDADAALVQSLQATVDAGTRMEQTSASTRTELARLDTRLDELVARAAEVSIGAGDGGRLGNDVDDLVTSLEGLRLAIEDTRRADSAPTITFDEVEQPAADTPPAEKPQTWPPQ